MVKCHTFRDLYNTVGLEPFRVENGNYKSQLVIIDGTLHQKYWIKTVNDKNTRIECRPIYGSFNKIVDLIVRKL